jgi:spore germination cell wall hydrolase CwlJ-like protein
MSQLLKFLIISGMFTPILGITAETSTDLQCLTANIFFEARGESIKGMKAVADITLNRTKHQAFPESICEVVKQKQQFSWVKGDKRSKKVLSEDLRGFKTEDLAAYQKAKVIATEALSEGYKAVLPRNVISFHSVAITPHWASNMKKYSTIGSHVFYSFKRKG